jgi:ABC-2 type transport system permease protein
MLVFFNGVYDKVPNEVTLRSDSGLLAPSSEDLNPLSWLGPKNDLSMIIGLLLTLIAILMSHDIITGEREQGTLRMVLSSPIRRSAVVAAKGISVFLLTFALLLYAVLLYLLVVSASSGGAFELSGGRILEMILLFFISLLTLIVFVGVGIAVSTAARHTSPALVASIGIWSLAVLAWPSLAPYIAASLRPAPLRQTAQGEIFAKEAEMIRGELAEHERAASELKAQGRGIQEAWGRYLEIKRRWIEQRRVEINRLGKERDQALEGQRSLAKLLVSVSPYGAFEEASTIICGTDPESYNKFVRQAEQYYVQEFLPASFESISSQRPWAGSSADAPRFEISPFNMPYPSLTERLKDIIGPVSILICEAIALLLIGVFRFERSDMK